MAADILSQIDASAALTISLASIAHAAGRVSTAISNPSPSKPRVLIFAQIRLSTSPVSNANSVVELYLIRGDAASPNIQDDNHDAGGGTTDAAYTAANAQMIGTLRASGAATEVLRGSFLVDEPGLLWSIGVMNRTGQALDSTGGNHVIRYQYVNPEIQ